jgi:1,4-dihydroxy-2-naphthoate octaprenyltransferase
LGRFQFLVGGFALYGLGVTIAWYSGAALNWTLIIWGQIIVTSTQLMVHYCNDYFDFEADQHNLTPTAWSGGSRVLQSSVISRQTALVAAIVLALIAIIGVLLLAMIEQPTPLAIIVGLLAIVLSWEYSAPPLRLHSRGVGELSSAITVAALTPLFGFTLLSGKITTLALFAVLPLCCLQFAMLLSVHNPDAEGDALVGKRTLIVRLGRDSAARLYLAVLVTAYLVLLPLTLIGLPSLVTFSLILTSPLALWLVWRMLRGDWTNPAHWGRFAFFSIALLIAATFLELAAFAILRARIGL